MTDGITEGSAGLQHPLFITGGAGDAGIPRTFLVGVGVPCALLTHCVMVSLTAEQHALALRTFSTRFTALREVVQVVAVVAHTRGIIGVGAGSLHTAQACALCTRLAFLCVAEIF